MKLIINRPLAGLVLLGALLGSAIALAQYPTTHSDRSLAVVPDIAANAACQRYTVGGTQLRKPQPVSPGGALVTPSARADYTLSPDKKILGFSQAEPPVDFAIVKAANRRVAVHLYANASNDNNIMVLNDLGQPLPIVEFALCSNAEDTDGTPALGGLALNLKVPRCGSEGTPAFADVCPDSSATGLDQDSQKILLIDVKSLEDGAGPLAFETALDARTCFCTGGDAAVRDLDFLYQCDDSLSAADTDPGGTTTTPTEAGGACTATPSPGTKVEEIGELSNDPYFCRTINGVRTCWKY